MSIDGMMSDNHRKNRHQQFCVRKVWNDRQMRFIKIGLQSFKFKKWKRWEKLHMSTYYTLFALSAELRDSGKQINHVQICYKRGWLKERLGLNHTSYDSNLFSFSTFIMSRAASNTLLLRRQLQELMKHPVEGFSAGKIHFTFYLDWGVISSQDLSMKIIYMNGKFWSSGESTSLSLVLHDSDRVVAFRPPDTV